MNKVLSIQLKAVFPFIIFSLNIFVGFACAIGVDMGFNTTHHHEEAEHKHSQKSGNDDCCNDKVVKLSQADKAVPQAAKLLSPVFFTAFVATYYSINITYALQVHTSNKYFVRGHHPPIPDIRIAIQSFQI